LESRFKYGVLGAGAVSASLIGKLPSKTRELGPVSAISYRVASRIANTLRAGYPVRKPEELARVPTLLFYAPPDLVDSLAAGLEAAEIDWTGRALVFCDCVADQGTRERFRARGATTAVARQLGISGRIVVEADQAGGAALHVVHRIARELHMKAIEILPGSSDLFDAAVTLGTTANTPLIDRAAALLRASGIRDIEAARIASSLFEQTARDYAHSGKQSWAWYVRKPPVTRLQAQIAAAGPHLEPVFRQLLLFAFETFGKHGEVGGELSMTSPEQDC
jgi:predicted short-subunit dehydrogenase-like oxidoreductase (DUF2520 family)